MDKFLEKIMNFINENTMLLIIICIFLIVILVIYLIDNTIKTRRLEQEELEKKNNPSPEVPETPVEEVPAPAVEEVAEVAPVVPVVETPVEEPKVEEDYTIPQEPVIDSSIEDLLNKDFSGNNEIVNNIPEEIKEEPVTPVVPVVETPKSKYNNDKKLSDIFGKKEEPKIKNIETTQDFSDELDRILKKLNEDAKNSPALEETSDYTNMF